jgi:cellulose synthase/poly-beta-1,6-N-acetylglucosamine synthase-like glycosyltransferase
VLEILDQQAQSDINNSETSENDFWTPIEVKVVPSGIVKAARLKRQKQDYSWLSLAVIGLYALRVLLLWLLHKNQYSVVLVLTGVIFVILAGVVFPCIDNNPRSYRVSWSIFACWLLIVLLTNEFTIGIIFFISLASFKLEAFILALIVSIDANRVLLPSLIISFLVYSVRKNNDRAGKRT